jgi:hypothetical protein
MKAPFRHARFSDARHFRTIHPSNPARVLNGRIVRLRDGIDWLLIGVVRKPLNASSTGVFSSTPHSSVGAMPMSPIPQGSMRSLPL